MPHTDRCNQCTIAVCRCLFEAVTAVETGVALELLVDGEFRNAKLSVEQLQASFKETVKALDIGAAQATVESDRQMILEMVRSREGGEQWGRGGREGQGGLLSGRRKEVSSGGRAEGRGRRGVVSGRRKEMSSGGGAEGRGRRVVYHRG